MKKLKEWIISDFIIRQQPYGDELTCFDILDMKRIYVDTIHPVDKDDEEQYISEFDEGKLLVVISELHKKKNVDW